MTAARYNIQIPAGTTYGPITFVLRHKIVLSAPALIGNTTLSVSPLPHGLETGNTLKFGDVTVTLTANASLGANTIQVESLLQDLVKGLSAKGNPVDLTGFSARAAIRAKYEDASPLATFTCNIPAPATNGVVTILLPSNVTTTLPANIIPNRADDIVDLQDATFPTATESKLFNPGIAPYFWDLECFNTASPPLVIRYLYGRVLVTAEATK
jgi:hypothetical protein